MSIRTLLVIFLAMGCGLSAAMGLNMVLATQQTAPQVETVPVVVAKGTIPRGRLISADLVEVQVWPKRLIPPGALGKAEEAEDRAALQTIVPGEPLFDAKLATKGAIGGMASIIPPGKRAYTITTKTQASNVAGFVLPGNLVDVLLTFRSQVNDETGGGSTTTLLQAVEVLAVGKQIEPVGKTDVVDAREIESVTLLVSPEQVAKLDLGQSLGMLSLSLRNPNDHDDVQPKPATIADIRFSQSEPVDPRKSPGSSALPPHSTTTADSTAQTANTSILTLRGQTWGAVRVAVPNRAPATAGSSGQ